MSERPSSTLRNARKHYLKCVDCGRQTLPRNASDEGPWAAAALLRISGRIDDGPLCFNCANTRRELLGLPVRRDVSVPAGAAFTCEARPRHVRINSRACTWEVSTLESLVTKWSDECFPKGFKTKDPRLLLVAVNGNVIRMNDRGSTPISDGDEITIVVGAMAGG
jgi:molybdopterin converting factor small subunit